MIRAYLADFWCRPVVDEDPAERVRVRRERIENIWHAVLRLEVARQMAIVRCIAEDGDEAAL